MPTDIHLDLRDARSLLEQSGTEDEKRKYRKAAEIILLKALRVEPENKEAKALLQSVRAVPALPATHPQEPSPKDVSFVAEPVLFKNLQPEKKNKSRVKLPIGITAAILVGGGVLWSLQSRPRDPATPAVPVAAVARTERINQSDFQPLVGETQNSSLPSETETEAPPPAPAEEPVSAPPVPVAAPPKRVADVAPPRKTISPPVVAEPRQSTPTLAMGSLAVNSPVAAEIYQNGQYLGSTPTTLQLPTGQQTLEYRHGELRSTETYNIKPNERTAASVTFQITVQINARPWAQVFLEGAPRRPLGQTPLSGVIVPVGGVLVFENPNFTLKTYRITEKDSAIQLNFP